MRNVEHCTPTLASGLLIVQIIFLIHILKIFPKFCSFFRGECIVPSFYSAICRSALVIFRHFCAAFGRLFSFGGKLMKNFSICTENFCYFGCFIDPLFGQFYGIPFRMREGMTILPVASLLQFFSTPYSIVNMSSFFIVLTPFDIFFLSIFKKDRIEIIRNIFFVKFFISNGFNGY